MVYSVIPFVCLDGFISAPVIEIYVSFNSNVGPTNIISKTADFHHFLNKFANLALV